eukprot:gene17321-23631_t
MIDLILRGALIRLFACENLPSEWVDNSNYIYNNYYTRSIVYLGMVMKPCARRFRPNGAFCERMRADVPDYCPHQLIYKMFVGNMPTTNEVKWQSGVHNPETKRKFVCDSWKTKVKWNEKCTDTFSDYNYIVKHVCLDPSQTAKTPEEEDMLCTLCKDAFCSNMDLVNSSASNTFFCTKMITDPTTKKDDDDDPNDLSSSETAEVFKRTCTVIMFTILVVLVMLSLFTLSLILVAAHPMSFN